MFIRYVYTTSFLVVGSKLNLQFLPVVRMLYCCGPRFRPDRPKLRRGYLHTVGTDRRYWAGISGLLIMHPRRHVRMFRTESGYIAVYWSSWTKRFRHNWHPMSVWIPESRLPDVLLFRWMQSGNLRMENRLSTNRLLVHHFYMVGSINSIFYFLHKAAEPFNCLEQDNLTQS